MLIQKDRLYLLELNEDPTITDGAALVRGLDGPGAGQDGTDERVADDGPLLWGQSSVLHAGIGTRTPRAPHARRRRYLAAAGEALVVVGGPAGAVGLVLVLEEARLGVFLQLLHVPHQRVVQLPVLLLHLLPPGPELAGVWHVDLVGKSK